MPLFTRSVAVFRTVALKVVQNHTFQLLYPKRSFEQLLPYSSYSLGISKPSHYRLLSHSAILSRLESSNMAGPNGVRTRGKRKIKPASPSEETPTKKQRSNSTASEYNNNMMDIDEREMEELSIVPAVGGSADAEWQKTIESVVQNVVSIRFCQTCAFDTDPAVSSEATGFVVDAERGYTGLPCPN